jgi:uncharacterized membrane protein
MADITNNLIQVFTDGRCSRVALYALNNCDAADTVDVAASFRVIKRAGLVSQTGTHIAAINTITGTVMTIPTGPLDDGVWLLVVGVAT